eukprot:704790_1
MALAQVQATYQTHIQTLKRPLYAFVKEETDLRLKYFVLIANHPVQSLRAILNLHSVPLDQYDMNSEIYQNFLSIAYEMIENKCNRGINFGRFKKEVNEKNVGFMQCPPSSRSIYGFHYAISLWIYCVYIDATRRLNAA